MRKYFSSLSFLLLAGVFAVFLVAGCSSSGQQSPITVATAFQDLEGREVPAEGDHTPLASAASAAPVGNTKGFTAPDFTIKAIDGKVVSLRQLTSEKPTLVYFFATWCPFCVRDFAVVKNVYPEFKGRVNFLAVDLDPKESAAKIAEYQKKSGLEDITFAPADTRVLQDYGITSTTTKFAVDRSRLILWRGSGEVDERTWRTILDGLASNG